MALSGKPGPGNGTSCVTAIEVAVSPFGVLCLEQAAGPETGEYRTQPGIIFILIFLLGYPSSHNLSRALKVGALTSVVYSHPLTDFGPGPQSLEHSRPSIWKLRSLWIGTFLKCKVSDENTYVRITYLKFNIKVITINL